MRRALTAISMAAACLVACSEKITRGEIGSGISVQVDSVATYGKGLNIRITAAGECAVSAGVTILDENLSPLGEETQIEEHSVSGVTTLNVGLSGINPGQYLVAVCVREDGCAVFQDTTSLTYLPSIKVSGKIIHTESTVIKMLVNPAPQTAELYCVDEKLTVGSTRIIPRSTSTLSIALLSCDVKTTGPGRSAVGLRYDGMEISVPVGIYAPLEVTFSSNSYGNLVLCLRDVSRCNPGSLSVRAAMSAYGQRDRYEDHLLTDSMLAQIEFDESASGMQSPLRRHLVDSLSYSRERADSTFIIPSVAGYAQKAIDVDFLREVSASAPSVRFLKFVLDYGQDVTGGVQVPTFDTSTAWFRPREWKMDIAVRGLDGYLDVRTSKDLDCVPEGMDGETWKEWADALVINTRVED